MKTEKMSFKNIKDVLSRDEMKKIMAGSGSSTCSRFDSFAFECTCNGNTYCVWSWAECISRC